MVSPHAAEVNTAPHREAFAKLVALRLSDVRWHLFREHGELYSQRRVATAIGRSQPWLSNLESGQRRIDVTDVRALCAFYGIDPATLVGEPASSEVGQYKKFLSEAKAGAKERARLVAEEAGRRDRRR